LFQNQAVQTNESMRPDVAECGIQVQIQDKDTEPEKFDNRDKQMHQKKLQVEQFTMIRND